MKRPKEYESYIKSSTWKNICTIKKAQSKNRCEKCGHGSSRLEVHHKTYERFMEERLDDLIVLCKDCHEEEDKKRKRQQEEKAAETLYEARFEGYMKKKYGEDFFLYEIATDEHYEEFNEWSERKDEEEYNVY